MIQSSKINYSVTVLCYLFLENGVCQYLVIIIKKTHKKKTSTVILLALNNYFLNYNMFK